MTTHFLELAIAIQRERNPRRRPALIDALPEPAREPCRRWLDDDARRAQLARYLTQRPPRRRR